MRISDWSSDVCSSDLYRLAADGGFARGRLGKGVGGHDGRRRILPPLRRQRARQAAQGVEDLLGRQRLADHPGGGRQHVLAAATQAGGNCLDHAPDRGLAGLDRKSTRLNSKSLMRTSYAVLCLKKK